MSEPEVVIHNGLFIFDKNIFGVIPEEKLDNHNQPNSILWSLPHRTHRSSPSEYWLHSTSSTLKEYNFGDSTLRY
ncbi:MAG: hypothetical protein V3R57_09030 [Candidatus Bathyarchaeia archaeon]